MSLSALSRDSIRGNGRPPVTSTLPSGSSVAVGPVRATFMLVTGVHVFATGS